METVASTRTALDQTLIDLDQIVAVFNANSNGPPDFDRLIGMLKRGQTLVAQATANANDESGADEGSAGHDGGESGGGGGGGPGRLRNRADAKRALEQICEFLERTEPGHPAPIFARRAVKLLDMNFLEIINELAPDSLPRVHDLGGIVPPE